MDGGWIIAGVAGAIIGAVATLIIFTWYVMKDL